MIATLVKLAFSGMRTRLLASVLTIMLSGAAAASIVLTLEVGATGVTPWNRTFDAAHGAHVLVSALTESDARAVAAVPGVAERDEPIPVVQSTMALDEREVEISLAGIAGPPTINIPVSTEGSELREGGIVLERSLASALGVQIGSTLTIATRDGPLELAVLGTAISPSQPRYPRSTPGLGWVTRSAFERIAPDHGQWRWSQAIRLTDPAAAPAFAERAAAALPAGTVYLATWEDQRDLALADASAVVIIVTAYTVLLLIMMYAIVAILVGARANRQHREIGLLKAVGLTPRQVSAIFVIESAGLGLVAVALGFAVGALLAPRLAAPSADTLISEPTIAANPWHLLVACGAILPVLIISALVATRRSTRLSALHAIRAGTPTPAARSRVAMLVERSALPLPIVLGLQDLLARRTRALWLTAALAVTGAAIVVTLSVQFNLNARPPGEASDVPRELPVLIYTLDAILMLITTTMLLAVAFLSVRERVRDFGVLKAIGLTPREISASLIGAHAVLALLASFVSIPAGIVLYLALYRIATGVTDDPAVIAPWSWLAAVPIALSLMAALATSIPARLATWIPAAEAVRYE